jgi:hypothetical protein
MAAGLSLGFLLDCIFLDTTCQVQKRGENKKGAARKAAPLSCSKETWTVSFDGC